VLSALVDLVASFLEQLLGAHAERAGVVGQDHAVEDSESHADSFGREWSRASARRGPAFRFQQRLASRGRASGWAQLGTALLLEPRQTLLDRAEQDLHRLGMLGPLERGAQGFRERLGQVGEAFDLRGVVAVEV